MSDPHAWLVEAACKASENSLFFPERGDAAPQVRRAKQVCRTCPSIAPCLELGLSQDYGIFGGTTESERRSISRERRRAS